MGGDADFTAPAELIGHPGRSAMLLALLDGRALPMSALAGEAGVAASTASAHLSRLVEGGLLRVRSEGRHRYYELASAEVVAALEALARLAPPRPVRSLRAGALGVSLMQALLDQGWVHGELHDPQRDRQDRLSAPGRDLDYRVTDAGWGLFSRLGVRVPSGRRRLTGYCVDWTEQRHHLAGAVGKSLLTRLEELEWVRRGAKGVPRALVVTDRGRAGFAEYFGIDVSSAGETSRS